MKPAHPSETNAPLSVGRRYCLFVYSERKKVGHDYQDLLIFNKVWLKCFFLRLFLDSYISGVMNMFLISRYFAISDAIF